MKSIYRDRVHFESIANREQCDVGGKALENIFPAMFAYKADTVVNMYSQKAGILVIGTFTMFLENRVYQNSASYLYIRVHMQLITSFSLHCNVYSCIILPYPLNFIKKMKLIPFH